MEGEQELVCDCDPSNGAILMTLETTPKLLNGTSFNDRE